MDISEKKRNKTEEKKPNKSNRKSDVQLFHISGSGNIRYHSILSLFAWNEERRMGDGKMVLRYLYIENFREDLCWPIWHRWRYVFFPFIRSFFSSSYSRCFVYVVYYIGYREHTIYEYNMANGHMIRNRRQKF